MESGCPDRPTPESERGTDLHKLLHRMLTADASVEMELALLEDAEVDALRLCASIFQQRKSAMDEPDVYLEHAVPGVRDDAAGTADAVLVDALQVNAELFDWKFGWGAVADPDVNLQLQAYAVGVAKLWPVHTIRANVVQPRIGRHVYCTWSRQELEELIAPQLLEIIEAASRPDAPLRPGDHCRYCLANERCPALVGIASTMTMPTKGVDALSVGEIADLLTKIELIRPLMNAIKERAYRILLASGDELRDSAGNAWVLAPGRTIREWAADPVPELERLAAELGRSKDDLYEVTLKSPAQIENTLGKTKAVLETVRRLVARRPGKPSLKLVEAGEQ